MVLNVKKNIQKFNEDFIKSYNEDSNKGRILEVDVEYPENLYNLRNDLPLLPEKMEEHVCNLNDKNNYVAHMRALKQALNHGLILKKVYRRVEFNQEAWLKPYIDMNRKLRMEAKNNFEKGFIILMDNSVFGKTIENVRRQRDIKLVKTKKERN